MKHNLLNFKVGDTAYLDGVLECNIQSITEKGMFSMVTSPLYSIPYEVMTNRLLRTKVDMNSSLLSNLRHPLGNFTPKQFSKEVEKIEKEIGTDGPTMEEFLDLEKMEQNLDTQLESETTESLNEWLDSKRSQFLDSCEMEDCPHCAYERQQEYEAELEKDACIEFGDWLTGQGVSYVDNTDEDNVYMVESNMNRRMTMKQIYEFYLKDQG